MMTLDAFAEIRNSTMLQDLSDAELAMLASVCEERQMAEGMTVFIENMPGEALFLIKKGRVRISRMFAEGDEKLLANLGPEEVFGEMAIIDGLPRMATARVVETVELISLRKKDFETLCQQEPALALKLILNITRKFSKRTREASDEYRDMLLWAMQEI